MRILFIVLSFIFISKLSTAQNSALDSLKMANIELENIVRNEFKKADSINSNILIVVRKYSDKYIRYVRFMILEDSCSRMYSLSIQEDYSIGHGTISSRGRINNCVNDFNEIKRLLNECDEKKFGYLNDKKPDLSSFSSSEFSVIGRIDGKYIYELFDKNYISEFHSGWYYYVLTSILFIRI